MAKTIPSWLKLHANDAEAELPASLAPDVAPPAALLDALTGVSGWQVSWESMPAEGRRAKDKGVQALRVGEAGRLMWTRLSASSQPLDWKQVSPLASSVAELLAETHHLRQTLRQREAELAVGIPVAPRDADAAQLADCLEAVLRGGAEAIGCQAAALYLLDDATTELKLRSAWRLPPNRWLEPARPLAGAVGDLEALTGHAVAIENTSLLPHWRVPEPFTSAVCVPVSSATTPLGTLWGFCTSERDFTSAQTNLWEIIAGRIAADLEREVLLAQAVRSRAATHDAAAARQWQVDRAPQCPPPLSDWECAVSWPSSAQPANVTADWQVLGDSTLAAYAAGVNAHGSAGALALATLRALFTAHAAYPSDAAQLLARVNESFYAQSPGDELAHATHVHLDVKTGRCQYAAAGTGHAFHIHATGAEPLVREAQHLGASPDARFVLRQAELSPGDTLLLVQSSATSRQPPLSPADWTSLLPVARSLPAAQQLQGLRQALDQRHASLSADTVLLALRRKS